MGQSVFGSSIHQSSWRTSKERVQLDASDHLHLPALESVLACLYTWVRETPTPNSTVFLRLLLEPAGHQGQ